jgi:hypothetical protein
MTHNQRRNALRAWRKSNPIHAAYLALKHNAKRRGKSFNLTLVEFEKFALETKYSVRKGTSSKSYHIDRIDENGPYSLENIQVLTNAQNVRKYCKWKQGGFECVTVKPIKTSADCPF